MVNENL